MSEGRAFADTLARRVLPRAVVAHSRVDSPARVAAAARRRIGRTGRVELFFAFDDPSSAVAVSELADRISSREVRLVLLPVVRRGMKDDPAVELKRRYAIDDARRRGARAGLELVRTEPLDPAAVSFLAEWAGSARQGPALTRFCLEALRRLWFDDAGGAVDREEFASLWRDQLGSDPPADDPHGVRRNERCMRRRGPYDTPAAWVHGQWFFAHDRVRQIESRLDDLGWTVSS